MVGRLLKQFTLDTGITQKEVAERLKYSPQRVNHYYRDAADPPREFLEKFRTEFHVDLKKLLDVEKKQAAAGTPSYNPIPVFDLELKPTSDAYFFNHNELIAYYVDVPMFNDCFAMSKVISKEMQPLFNPSDIIALKKIKNIEIINFGAPFAIFTDEQRFLRYIRANDAKSYLLRSGSPELFDDIIVNKKDIKHLFEVKGKMCRL